MLERPSYTFQRKHGTGTEAKLLLSIGDGQQSSLVTAHSVAPHTHTHTHTHTQFSA